jgi:hypothetical protein
MSIEYDNIIYRDNNSKRLSFYGLKKLKNFFVFRLKKRGNK